MIWAAWKPQLAARTAFSLGAAAVAWHSLRALPGAARWASGSAVMGYGALRGAGVRWVSHRMGAAQPYELARPLPAFAGISPQELIGGRSSPIWAGGWAPVCGAPPDGRKPGEKR